MAFDHRENDIITLALEICNCLSLLGSLSIMVIYFSYRSLRSFAFQLIVFMSLADIIRAVGFELSPDNRVSCEMQGILTNFGSLSSVVWTSIIAYCMYSVIVLENTDIVKHKRYFLVIAYLVPFVLSVLPLSTDSVGPAEGWCWFKKDKFEYLWRIAGFYALLLIAISFNCFCYFKVIREINADLNMLRNSKHEIISKSSFYQRLNYYPLVLIICYLPVLSKRLYEASTGSSLFWLTLLSAISTSTIGLFNAIVYGFTEHVTETIFSSCRKRRDSVSHLSPFPDEGINNSFVSNI